MFGFCSNCFNTISLHTCLLLVLLQRSGSFFFELKTYRILKKGFSVLKSKKLQNYSIAIVVMLVVEVCLQWAPMAYTSDITITCAIIYANFFILIYILINSLVKEISIKCIRVLHQVLYHCLHILKSSFYKNNEGYWRLLQKLMRNVLLYQMFIALILKAVIFALIYDSI